MKFLKSFVGGKLVWGDLLSGKIIRRGKFSSRKIICHLTKISSLLPDEVFPDKVHIEISLPDFVEIIIITRIIPHVMIFITTANIIRLPPFVMNLGQILFFKRSETRNSFFKQPATYVSGISFMSKILVT